MCRIQNKKLMIWIALLAAIAAIAFSQQADPESDFRAQPVNGGNGVRIVGYVGSKWDVKIPSHINGLPVTHIGGKAFYEKNLISITIPDTVTHIEDGEYRDDWLSIGMNDGEPYITGAFVGNELTSIVIPDNVYVGNYAFRENPLTSITIGENVDFGDSAFGLRSSAERYEKNGRKAAVITVDRSDNKWRFAN